MISAVVISHNSRHHLRSCLQSLAGQPKVADVVVVDNASTDGSVGMVRNDFPTCRLLQLDTNLGFGAANNRGAAIAGGDRLLLINSDARLAEDALGLLDRALDTDSRLALAAPQLRYPDAGWQFTWVPETGILGEALQKLRNPFEGAAWNHRWLPGFLRLLSGPGWYTAACVLLRRQAFEAVEGFDLDYFLYFEDVDLCRRLRLAGWRLGQVQEAVAWHVKGGSSGNRQGEVHYRRAQRLYYAKQRPRWEQRLLCWRQRRRSARQQDPELRRQLLAVWNDDIGD